MHELPENRFLQTPFSKLLVQVDEKNNYIELYTKYDVLMAPVQPPLIKFSFVKHHECTEVFKSYSIPLNTYMSFICIIVFPQIFATFLGMEAGRLFIFTIFVLFFFIYNAIISYFSMRKINDTLLNIIKKYE